VDEDEDDVRLSLFNLWYVSIGYMNRGAKCGIGSGNVCIRGLRKVLVV
jgi:hypothetical protein